MSTVDSAAGSNAGSGRGETARMAAILAAVVGVVALLVLLGGRQPLETSAIGFAGLEQWLTTKDIETVPAVTEGNAGDVFRIMPVYDPKLLGAGQDQSDGREKKLGSLAPRPLSQFDFVTRAKAGPMLAVLPKWRGGIISRGAGHPDLLVPENAIQMFDERPVSRLPQRGFGAYDLYDIDYDEPVAEAATLYSAQVLSPAFSDKCRPVVVLRDKAGKDLGTLIADCTDVLFEGSDYTLFVLADPDILDNAGLALGDNASLALTIVRGFAGNAKIFVDKDTSAEPMAASATSDKAVGKDPRQRTLADLDRFFVYPFSLFWIGVALVTGLALWRGSRRFGRPKEDVEPAEASKRRTIDASRRILMLARSDASLVDRHVRDRLEALASGLLGAARRARGAGDDATAIGRFLSRRAPEIGRRFSEAYAAVTAPDLGERSRLEALGAFETVIQETWHEFGRTAGPARQDRR
ncbi:hypothetical protein E3C22_08295 [Jiella endophytica]|uniref:DUF4350 domain-containing protein n=1 Tax=Jiella endophytica TaxID=2558362 RepID=A0A4Y8RQK2_9HYPH|nr:hypothetical protein [Jiella endophytica]TFF25350.1 hypothetical protein E3C22_08295 [Jiella endophytica]